MKSLLHKLFSLDVWLDVRTIGFLLMILAFGSATFGYMRVHGTFDVLTMLADFYANISAELGSIAITVLIIDTVNRRYEAKQRIRDLQDDLIRQAGSSINATAVTAVDTIRRRGWLYGEGVQGHTAAILKDADLSSADLQGADLSHADLRGANLEDVNLNRATLRLAMLQSAHLRFASFQNADLWRARLSGADLRHVKFNDADLSFADLNDTLLERGVMYNEKTILPDGSKWTPDADMGLFGAETREIVSVDVIDERTSRLTFADGVQRRWRRGTGWLD